MFTNNEKREGILRQVQSIFAETFGGDSAQFTESTSPADVPEWDSLHHVMLCVEVESRLKIRMTPQEMVKFTDIRSLVDLIEVRNE